MQYDVSIAEEFALPRERVWGALVDHEAMAHWTGATVRVVARGDRDAGGVGTVRRVRVGPLEIDEEITYADAPVRMAYRVLRGAPLHAHRGEILLIEDGAGTRVEWNIRFDSPRPAGGLLASGIEAALRRSLGELRGLIGG